MSKAASFLVFLLLASVNLSCTKQCEDCSDEFKLHFNFRNKDQQLVYKNIDALTVTDKENNALSVEWKINESDSVYVLSLDHSNPDISLPDSVIFIYDNQTLDSGGISYGYQRDNECCNNPRVVDGLNMLHLDAVRLIKREYDVYSIIVEN